MKAPSSRRALLAGLAASPLLASPALAAEIHPDAALLALESAFLEANAALDAAHAEVSRIDRIVETRIGAHPRDGFSAEGRAWRERAGQPRVELGWQQACDAVELAHADAWDVVKDIIAMRPTTLDGLQMKARVLKAFELDARDDILDEILAVRSTGRA